MSVTINIVTRPLSTMGVNTCTLESMVSYHYPPRIQDKTIVLLGSPVES